MLSIQRTIGAGPGNASLFYGRGCCITSITCSLLFISILETPQLFGAELFPFTPPTNQQRGLDQSPRAKPQLSRDDIARATRLADQAKKLTPAEQQQFRETILHKQKDAVREGNIAQAQYYTELLTQLRQDNR